MKIQKAVFIDNSSIELNENGYLYTGGLANDLGHIMRKHNKNLEQLYLSKDIDMDKVTKSLIY